MGAEKHLPADRTKPGAWLRLVGLGAWLGLLAFGVQFALASASELEPQAAVMGWLLVAIALGAGLTVLAAARLNHAGDDD